METRDAACTKGRRQKHPQGRRRDVFQRLTGIASQIAPVIDEVGIEF